MEQQYKQKNCLIGNRSIKGFFISLEKDADVIIGGIRQKKLGCSIILFFKMLFILPFCIYDTSVEIKME